MRLDDDDKQWIQMTIDERLEALTRTLESMSRDSAAWWERQKRLDARERRARRALAEGIATYFKALNEEPDEKK